MRYLTFEEVLRLHALIIEASGGSAGVRDPGIIDSAVAQPQATFDGIDLHEDLLSKARALCFSLVQGHGFVDGNKRIGHAAMVTFLRLNGADIVATVDVQEKVILDLAASQLSREKLAEWLRANAVYVTETG